MISERRERTLCFGSRKAIVSGISASWFVLDARLVFFLYHYHDDAANVNQFFRFRNNGQD
jgi:hypothetical protein